MFQIIYICFLFIFGFNLCQCFDEAWYHYQSSLENDNREELVVTNVTADEHLVLQSKVQQWKSMSIGSTCYTVGVLDTNITILFTTFNKSRSGFNVHSNIIDIKRKATDIKLIQNYVNGTSELIIIASFLNAPELIWYKIQNKTLREFWSWPLQKPVTHINSFRVSYKDILLVVYSENKLARLDTYRFDIKSDTPHLWFIQSISLTEATNSTAFNELGDYGFLSIPQHSQNQVLVYKFEDNNFIQHDTIKSLEVTTVVSFEIISKTFLAIDGYDAGIYEFVGNDIVEHKIVHGNLHNIHYWLPIPVRTLRDEFILLAQRKLDHATHETGVVEIFTFNGDRFEEHEDIPCVHYEEKVESLTCLSIDNGIVGSGFVTVGFHYGLIVPRYSTGSSNLFTIHLHVKQLPNPKKKDLEQLENIRNALQERVKFILNSTNEKSMQPGKHKIVSDNILKNTEDNNIDKYTETVNEIGEKIEALQEKLNVIRDIENRTKFDTIIFTGPVILLGDASFSNAEITEIDGIPANELLEDIVRKNDIHQTLGNKTFTDLEVEELNFETVNGIHKDNILYNEESTIVINGNVTFSNPLKLGHVQISDHKINDIDLENEIVQTKNKYNGTLEFENVEAIDYQTKVINELEISKDDNQSNDKKWQNIEMDSIHIPENVTVNYINGKNFSEFIHSLCLVNVKCHIPGTVRINGNITVTNASTETLNGFQFPGEFITNDTSSHAIITGEKRFNKSLTAQEIRMRGTVDGLDTKKIITLSTDQAIPGTISFNNLELTEELNVTGKILGENLDKFVPNPTLEIVNIIKSNVNFNTLEVEGDIFLEKTFNNQHFETLLNDVVYNDDDNITISASKDFKRGLSIARNLEIESNSINNIKLDDIVTKNTDQELDINLLNGNVKISDLFLSGLYDDMNITEIDESLVKLTGEQFISSTFIFTDEVEVEGLEIEKLNDLTSDQYLYYVGDRVIKNDIVFENIAVENLIVEKDFNGNIVSFDVDDLNKRYFSYTKNQTIDTDFIIRVSNIDRLEIKNVNREPDHGIINSHIFLRTIREKLENGTMKVHNLHVSGSLEVDRINDKDISTILPKDPLEFLQRKENITISGDVYFDEIEINFLGNVNWTQLTKELVYKNETNLRLKGPALFKDSITVEKLIETDKINNVLLNNILTKTGYQEINGPVYIHGNASFENVTIIEDINSTPVALILDRIKVDNSIYTIKDDMVFKRLSYIYDLNVNGTINHKQFQEVLSNKAYIDTDIVMEGDMIFKKPVNISGNIGITGNVNNFNISILPKIVLTTYDEDIQGPVHFQRSVAMEEKVNVNELDTRLLYGFDTNDWVSRAIFLDAGLLKGNYTFKDIVINEELSTNFINDVDMSMIVPLKSNQTIAYLEFDEVKVVNDIKVGNTVNNRKLPEEFERTVMRDLDQAIISDVLFQNYIVVRQNLTTNFINNEDVSNIVTTNTNQNLTGTYNFISKAIVESDVLIHGMVNSINLTAWADNSVKIFTPEGNDVAADWNVTEHIDFRDDVIGDFIIDAMDIEELAKEIDERKRKKYEIEYKTIKDYQGMCKDLRYMREKAQHQLFKFKYFEDLQLISYPNNIQHVFYFSHDNKHYLLVNEDNCLSHMLIFNGNKFYPLEEKINTGHISQTVVVREGGVLYVVSRGNQNGINCSITGTNVWEIANNTMDLRFNIQNQILLQESNVPATFYGLSEEGVIEYKINSKLGCSKYRRWDYTDDNAMFVPRGLQTGLALRTGSNIVYLDRSNSMAQEVELDTESILKGGLRAVPNHFMPGKNGGDVLITNVGIRKINRNLLAVTENIPRGSSSLIKIYSNPLIGELFQQIPALSPSSLVSLEYGQAETLLVFMENKQILQVYEYKGIEGFKYLASTKMPASELFGMTLPVEPYLNSRKCIGVVNSNKIRIIQSVMTGNRLEENINCDLF